MVLCVTSEIVSVELRCGIDNIMKKVAEVVFIPSPLVGHLVSTLEFAKLLVNRDECLHITVLVIKFPHTSETHAYTHSFAYQRVHIITLPQCPLPTTTDPASSMQALLEAQKPNVKQAVSNLTGTLAAFVVDMFCTTMIDVAKDFHVPALVFYTSGVASLGLMLHLYTLREQDPAHLTTLQDSLKNGTDVSIPSFANPVPSKTLTSSVLRKDYEPFFISFGRGLKKADGIVVNSFEELEPYAVRSFSDPALALPPIYPVGPILNLNDKAIADSDSDSDSLKWLDHQPPSSVVFLCFGSRGSFDEDQVREIARGVEDSGARFLWSLRKPPPKGTMAPPTEYTLPELAEVLPEGFLDRTVEIGRVIGWAAQAQILAHPATGGFVSHCGWNSTLESIYLGVPIATWPLFAEQQTNAFELVRELKMGVEIALDYRVEMDDGPNYLLTADRIEKGIRSVLEMDGEIREKVKEISEKSSHTLLKGGSSYAYLSSLVHYLMNQI